MQTSPRHGRASQAYSSAPTRQRRSGYEPSDTETDFQESPWRDFNGNRTKSATELEPLPRPRNASPLKASRRFHSSRFEHGGASPTKNSAESSNRRRHSSKSPYKPSREDSDDDGDVVVVVPSLSRSQRWSNERATALPRVFEVGRASKKASYASKRSVTAPRLRPRESEDRTVEKKERTPSPLPKSAAHKQREAPQGPMTGEINERVAQLRLVRDPTRFNDAIFESTDSISPGDIFFSREWTVLAMPKKSRAPKPNLPPPHRDVLDANKTSSSALSQTATIFSSSGSRQGSSRSGRFSTESSKMSDASAKTTESMRKFTANRRKSQKETWFGCVKKGSCRSSRSPERAKRSTNINETLFIEKAFVVEKLTQFWADQYQPCSLNGFTCHKQQAQLLKQLVSDDICPHILLKGPSGSGKRSLAMALLREIYGDASSNISYDLRHFQVQENRLIQVVVPVASSAHHLELNVRLEANAKYALMGLIREITKDNAITPETSNANLHANYKVIVLYDVDKTSDDNIQHLIKWILDCYADSCKLVLCCEDDAEIIKSVTSRCKVIKVDAPITHEIMEVLIQISKKEDFDLSMGFAAKIAVKSKQNLRKAIMALEACKAHNYPFLEDQPIPIGWEDVSVEIACEILANPSPNTLFLIRGRFQKLLADFVHPKLILLKLVEQFLKGIDANIKRELYYWHAYYDKRLPIGPSALLKIEEFVAKFMSIYRKSSINRQVP